MLQPEQIDNVLIYMYAGPPWRSVPVTEGVTLVKERINNNNKAITKSCEISLALKFIFEIKTSSNEPVFLAQVAWGCSI